MMPRPAEVGQMHMFKKAGTLEGTYTKDLVEVSSLRFEHIALPTRQAVSRAPILKPVFI